MVNAVLQKMGLTPKEAEVYEILLRLGEVPVGDILKLTGDHPQIIYRAIDGLQAQGLVIAIEKRHRKYVRAEDPKRLEEIEEKRLNEIKSLVPELRSIQKGSHDAIVRVSKGNEAVRSLRVRGYEELRKGEVYYIIGASGDRYYEVMGDLHAENERKRIKKGVRRKLLSFENYRALINQQDSFAELAEFRFLPAEYPIPSSTNIFKDTVAILIWESEPIVITIESPEVAESYRHYFETLWQIAKP